VNQNLE